MHWGTINVLVNLYSITKVFHNTDKIKTAPGNVLWVENKKEHIKCNINDVKQTIEIQKQQYNKCSESANHKYNHGPKMSIFCLKYVIFNPYAAGG